MEEQKTLMAQFEDAFKAEGRSKRWIADGLGIHISTLSKIINGDYTLTERNRNKMNELLGTNIGDPEPDKTEV
jgi:plasmid maintenance system antidote protein VapI